MPTTDLFSQLKLLLGQYIQLFKDMEQTESSKAQAAESYDVGQLNQCMKEEQAFILMMKGYEKKRQDLFQSLSISIRIPLSELLPCLPAHKQDQFKGLFSDLRIAYDGFQSVYRQANGILDKNGKIIDGELNRLKAQSAGMPYEADGRKKKPIAKTIRNLQI